jgi:quercetin dioxygenase-like cupin family protein
MIERSQDFAYPEVELTTYKDEPGTWLAVTKRVLASDAGTKFETRYFEIAPGGYTSFERHQHEHVVVVLRGAGEVRLNDLVSTLVPSDVVRVAGQTPHQFRNPGSEPFGILCIVDRDRDRPVLLQDDGSPRASE